MGIIAATNRMPSAKFVFPKNNANLEANTTFTIKIAVRQLHTGYFVNPDNNFLSAPQQVDENGLVLGHSHIVIEKLSALDQTEPTDPEQFAVMFLFFICLSFVD
jgi:hypothetical protein